MEGEASQRSHIDPGPIERSVLYMQKSHRSESIWWSQEDDGDHELTCRRSVSILKDGEIDPRVEDVLRGSGLYAVAKLGFFQLDHHLITALVERWRPETHTFHLPEGEATITLQDVAIQIGLPIDGNALVCPIPDRFDDECERLLGVRPPPDALRKNMLSLRWLNDTFEALPPHADQQTVINFSRAYLLRIVSGVLFSSKSGGYLSLVYLPLLANIEEIPNYSWGGACLAFLYRELCKAAESGTRQIGGPLFILQVWAWDRVRAVAPILRSGDIIPGLPLARRWSTPKGITTIPTHTLRHIRYALDLADKNDFIWEPYTVHILQQLPEYCFQGNHLWRAVVPLICMHIVEWHQPDRVLRQFGLQQHIPRDSLQTTEMHEQDLSSVKRNIMTKQARWINLWNDRANLVFHAEPSSTQLHYHSAYMEWYRRITRRWISVSGAAHGAVADGLERLALVPDMDTVQQIRGNMCAALGEERRYVRQSQPPNPAPSATYPDLDVDVDAPAPSITRRRRRRTQTEGATGPSTTNSAYIVPHPIFYHVPDSQEASSSWVPGPSQPTPSQNEFHATQTQQYPTFSQWSRPSQSPWNMSTMGSPSTPSIFPPFAGPSSIEHCFDMSSMPSFQRPNFPQENYGPTQTVRFDLSLSSDAPQPPRRNPRRGTRGN